MSEIFAVQLTAVATLALAFLALATAVFAGGAFRTQNRQFQDQLHERNRKAEERPPRPGSPGLHLAGPPEEHYSIGRPRETNITGHARNTSRQPVYDLRITWLNAGEPLGINIEPIAPLMPGEQETSPCPVPPEIDPDGITASARFRDRAGLWWCIRSDGRLEEFGLNGAVPDASRPRWARRMRARISPRERPPSRD